MALDQPKSQIEMLQEVVEYCKTQSGKKSGSSRKPKGSFGRFEKRIDTGRISTIIYYT
jgi:hypothetical protein